MKLTHTVTHTEEREYEVEVPAYRKTDSACYMLSHYGDVLIARKDCLSKWENGKMFHKSYLEEMMKADPCTEEEFNTMYESTLASFEKLLFAHASV